MTWLILIKIKLKKENSLPINKQINHNIIIIIIINQYLFHLFISFYLFFYKFLIFNLIKIINSFIHNNLINKNENFNLKIN